MLDRFFSHIATRISGWAGQPAAFVLAIATILVWIVSGPLFGWSDTWQLVINTGTTIVTFLMVFLIQNAQNRDAAAMQVKLDEVIRAMEGARNDFIGIEHLTDTELVRIRDTFEESENGGDKTSRASRAELLTQLIARR